jgi:hypothetical protein
MVVEELVNRLWAPSNEGEVYMILDCARDPRIFESFARCDLEYHCLYEAERIAEPLRRAAPYLVRLRPWSEYTSWVLTTSWNQSWGVFLSTRADTMALRQHLRRFLLVVDEEGRQLYFRYYDPRVLRAYLPTCTIDEAAHVFGPIHRFWSESADGRTLIEYFQADDGVRRLDLRV